MKKLVSTAVAAMAAMIGASSQKGEKQNTQTMKIEEQKAKTLLPLVRPVYEGTAREYGEYLLNSGKYRHNNLKRKKRARGIA